MDKLNLQNLSFAVLLGGPVFFGASGQAAEAAACVLAGAIGLAFTNLDKIKRFKGTGFEAETWEQKLNAMIAKETEPELYQGELEESSLEVREFELDESVATVLIALDNPRFTWRSVGGVSEESGFSRAKVARHLKRLEDKWLSLHIGHGKRVNWGLTGLGRDVAYRLRKDRFNSAK